MNTELRIAVIGAGPAGVYSSDIFLRQLKKLGEELGLGTEARIDLFEKLPVPFGLVRYGVAPDHPSIKFIASALEKTLDNPNIHLYCDVEFGKDVTLDDLLARYDAVLFATGAVKDKPLNLPGADLEGVYGAAKFVEWYDGYPTGAREWPLTAENVAVIGGGNVAMDVARELMRNADDLKAKTDIPDNVYEGIGQNKAKVLHLFIRRAWPGQVQRAGTARDGEAARRAAPSSRGRLRSGRTRPSEVAGETSSPARWSRLFKHPRDGRRHGRRRRRRPKATSRPGNYYVHFNSAPTEILGETARSKRHPRGAHETGADGKMHRTGEFTDYPVEAVHRLQARRSPPALPTTSTAPTRPTPTATGAHHHRGRRRRSARRLYATGWATARPVYLIGSTSPMRSPS